MDSFGGSWRETIHEKDDRHRLDDHSPYVLGWTNAAQIAVLENKARGPEIRLGEIG